MALWTNEMEALAYLYSGDFAFWIALSTGGPVRTQSRTRGARSGARAARAAA